MENRLLEDAIALAVEAHRGQVDKANAPYILHPLRLMLAMDSDAARVAAMLHDVVEDTAYTLDLLKERGFPEDVITAVDCLSRRDGESYEAFIERIGANPLATKVKLADLEDNLNVSRLATLDERDVERLNRYLRSRLHLRSVVLAHEPPHRAA